MTQPYIQANTNGRLHSALEPSLSPLNRGFLYGDAIYEVWRTYAGRLFAWEEHFARLESSARAIHLEFSFTRATMLGEIKRTAAAFRQAAAFDGDLYVRLQVSRGAGPIGLDVALADSPEFVILIQPRPTMTALKAREGLKLSIATGVRRNPVESLSPAWKTGNYLNNILGLREAKARGADEVVMLNLNDEITEAAVSNIAFIRDGEIVTPPLQAGILAGITRRLVQEKIASTAGLRFREEVLKLSDLAGMQECFLLGTSNDIVPVAAIDEFRFTIGPGTVSAKLKTAFAAYYREYAAAHSELVV
jgi:branched-chain amino acid aminotransferase